MTEYLNREIVGAGGHARVVASECLVYVGDEPVYWSFGPLFRLCCIGNPYARKREVEAHGGSRWAVAVSHNAIISAVIRRNLGEGTQVLAGAIIAVGAKIGKHAIINHNAVVDHDCIVGDYAHIAPGACLSGGVKVGEGAWIGANACVVSGEVPPWMLVRAGSVFPNDYTKGLHKLKPVPGRP